MDNAQSIDLGGNTQDIARWIWKNLVPKSGQASSVQGEILRAIEKLRWEAQGNGNINWDEGFITLIDFLYDTLGSEASFSEQTRASIQKDLYRLKVFVPPEKMKSKSQINDLPYIHDDLYDRLTEHLVSFCRQYPQVLPRELNSKLLR